MDSPRRRDEVERTGRDIKQSDTRLLLIFSLLYIVYAYAAFYTPLSQWSPSIAREILLLSVPLSFAATFLLYRVLLFWSRWHEALFYIPKFAIAGIANTLLDLGILNALLYAAPTHSTLAYGGYKAIAFLIATTHSFFWNKYWVFEKRTDTWWRGYGWFVGLTMLSTVINVAVSVIALVALRDYVGITHLIVAGDIGAVAGTVASIALNYMMYRILFRTVS